MLCIIRIIWYTYMSWVNYSDVKNFRKQDIVLKSGNPFVEFLGHVRVESCCVQDSRWALVQCFSGGGIPRKLTWHWKIPKTNIWQWKIHHLKMYFPLKHWDFPMSCSFSGGVTWRLCSCCWAEVRSCSWFGDVGGKVHIQRGVEVFSRGTNSFKTFKILGIWIWFWCHFQKKSHFQNNPHVDTTFSHISC